MCKTEKSNSKTLAEFVEEAHSQISHGTLKVKSYRKVVKRLLFELAATIDWLHTDCSNLNISTNSILIENGDIENGKINPEISMVLLTSELSGSDISKNDVMHSFGIISYYCFIGKNPFESDDTKSAIINGRLKQYLRMNNLLSFISPKALDILNKSLNVDESQSLSSQSVIQHKYFKDLFKQYGNKKRKENISIVEKEESISFSDIFMDN